MKMILMGTGTSQGVPAIGCQCEVCMSPHKEDKRMRCSAYIENDGNSKTDSSGVSFPTTNLLIDCGPEFRTQALRTKIKRLDGVLITHSHADHAHGLDDLRIFSHTKSDPVEASLEIEHSSLNRRFLEKSKSRIKDNYKTETSGNGLSIYSNQNTVDDLVFRFAYVFRHINLGGGLPKFNILPCTEYTDRNPLEIGSVEIIPIPMLHGSMNSTGWILSGKNSTHAIAYLTDCSFISTESLNIIKNCGKTIDHLIIDGLRVEPHSSHCNFAQALEYAEKIQAKHTWLTHFTHNLFHSEIQEYLDGYIAENPDSFPMLKKILKEGGSVSPAYDELELNTDE